MAEKDKKRKPFNPSAGDTPQARTAAKVKGALRGAADFVGNVGGFLVDSAATAGQTGVMGATRDLPGAGMQTPQTSGLRGAPVMEPRTPPPPPTTIPQKPAAGNTATDSTPVQTSTDATAPPGTAPVGVNNLETLRNMGVKNPEMAAVGGGRTGRQAVIRAGANEFVNLGDPAEAGGPNIFGKSSTPGGRMDTFVGAGRPDPNNPTTNITTGGQGTNSALYNNADPFNLRNGGNIASRGVRAGQREFRGQGGSRGVRANELRRINQQANRAFSDALKGGMNTKAALRISQSIRAGGELLEKQAGNEALRYGADQRLAGAQYASDASTQNAALREQGYMTRAQAAAQRDLQGQQFEIFADQFIDPETGERDTARVSRMVQNAGGLERFMNASPEIQQKLADRGNALSQLLDNVNQVTGRDGTVYSTIGALSGGAKLPRSDATIIDAFTSGNISMIDAIFGADKFELADGTMIEASDVLGDIDKETIVKMSPEDRRDLIALTGE